MCPVPPQGSRQCSTPRQIICKEKPGRENRHEGVTLAARSGGINPSDLKGGTVTISNIGAIGGISASPIINKPEVAIVALGKIQNLPRFNEEGQIKACQIMTVSWSGDHRVIDVATIANFNNSSKKYIENPNAMLATMV